MLDHEHAHSVLDYLGDKAFGPSWIILGMAEVASAVTSAMDGRYASGLEGLVHHSMDIVFPALTTLVGFISMRDRRIWREKQMLMEQERIRLKHALELEKLKTKCESLIGLVPQPEADSDETVDLGPVS